MTDKKETYLALLRGINVGGNNLIKMIDLKSCFEKLGFNEVITYIQSGNVLFSTIGGTEEKLTRKIEEGLLKKFELNIPVVVVSKKHLFDTVKLAPKGFGSKPEEFKYDVIFLKPPLKAAEAIKSIPLKEGVDQVTLGKGVIYFSREIKHLTQSRMSKIISSPIYKLITIRNWNTTTKLLKLTEQDS